MKIRFTPAQSEWLKKITGTDDLQQAVDFFLLCMEKEKIAAEEILNVVKALMNRKLLPPGKK